ncbi:MAG: hypothetical protein H0V26_01540 [Solirubrobacterales bacterium]|nr:hypothetical protein [Solirubrobacterales bacterium]
MDSPSIEPNARRLDPTVKTLEASTASGTRAVETVGDLLQFPPVRRRKSGHVGACRRSHRLALAALD